jgi:phage terminase large subunit GpA-like protein
MNKTAHSESDLAGIWREAWRPPDRRPPWAWAEEHIGSIPYSPIPGRFRSDNSPQIREPLEALIDPRVCLVFIIAAIQAGKTSVGELGLCHIIANLPGPTLWLDQTDDDAKDQAESRLHKLFEDCAPVKALFPSDRHKKRNTTIHFRNGMTLWVRTTKRTYSVGRYDGSSAMKPGAGP